MNYKCKGCGYILQNKEESKLGFLPLKIFDDNMYCKRCFKLKHYGVMEKNNFTYGDFFKTLKNIDSENSLILIVVDIINIPFELNKLIELYKKENILFVITKRDLLPVTIKEEKILNYFNKFSIPSIIISSKNNYNMDVLINKINSKKNNNKVYVTGYANAGKSTLINKIIKNYSEKTPSILTSNLPNTTINILEIEINENLILVDTPGIIIKNNIFNNLSVKEINKVTIDSMIKPKIYSTLSKKSLILEKFCRINYLDDNDNNSLILYVSNNINIMKINHQTRKEEYKDYDTYDFYIEKDTDVVINGLGFIKIKKECNINIQIIKDVLVYTRKTIL
ncbi:MAG: GTPase [Bacilli bacterium]